MHLPLRTFLLLGLLAGAAACQTHDRVMYENRPPKNLRVRSRADAPELPPLDTTSPSANPAAATPATGGPTLPAAAQ